MSARAKKRENMRGDGDGDAFSRTCAALAITANLISACPHGRWARRHARRASRPTRPSCEADGYAAAASTSARGRLLEPDRARRWPRRGSRDGLSAARTAPPPAGSWILARRGADVAPAVRGRVARFLSLLFFSPARALGAKLAAVPKCGCGGAVVDVGGHRRPCVRPPRWRCWIYRRRARRVPRRGRLGRGRAPVAWRVWAAPSATVFGARDALEEYMAARACMASIYIAR